MIPKTNFNIVLLLLLLLPQTIVAQQGFTPIERLVLDRALSAIENYETVASISDDDAYYSFLDLFIDDSAIVYNDLLGLSNSGSMSVKEYALMQKQTKNTQVYVMNIKKERIWKEQDEWKVRYSFEKKMSYANDCGVYFSSEDFYEENYKMMATLVYDARTSRCKFERIDGEINSSKKMPESFYTFQRSEDYDDGLKYNNKTLHYNSYGQAYLSAPVTKAQFKYADADVTMLPVIDDQCKMVTAHYKAKRFAIKPHFDLFLGDCYDLGKAPSAVTRKTSATSFGLDVGYYLPLKSRLKIGLFTGVGINSSKIDLAYSSNDFHFTTSADVDGETYTRYYTNFSMAQSVKISDLVIPVYVDFNYHFNHIFSLYADLGFNFNFNMSHKISDVTGSANVYGFYNDGDGGHNKKAPYYDYNGFGDVTFGLSNVIDSDLKDFSGFTADLLAGFGIRFKIPNTSLSVDFGLNYLMGLTNVLKENSNKPALYEGNVSTPIAYNVISGVESVENLHSLTEVISPLKHKALRLHVGLMLKF